MTTPIQHCSQFQHCSQYRAGDLTILYDARLWSDHPAELFQDHLDCRISVCGRGGTRFISMGGLDLVRKQYLRGGLYRHLVRESYLFTSLEDTRMWREFQLLTTMRALRLPVPEPVALRCRRRGLFYRGELITVEIPGCKPLLEYLTQEALSTAYWSRIGTTLRAFHEQGVNHADLNAGNILLDQAERIWLVDFDKGCLDRPELSCWRQRNLSRLLRSLHKAIEKQRLANKTFHFSESDWRALRMGYESLSRRTALGSALALR